MADSCSDINAAIARLEKKIDAISKVNEQSIIDKVSSLLKPEIATAVGVGFVATQKAGIAESLATQAQNTASGALSRVLGILGALSGLFALYGVTQVLPQRMDVIENYVDSVASDLSRALGLISGLSSRVDSHDRQIGGLNRKDQDHDTKLRRHNDKLYEHTKQLEKHSSNLKANNEKLKNHNDKLYEHTKQLEKHSSNLKANNEKLKNHNDKLYEHGKGLERHNTILQNHASQLREIPVIKNTTQNLQNTVTSLSNSVAAVPILQGTVAGLGQRVGGTEAKTTSLQNQIDALKQNPSSGTDYSQAIASAQNTANQALQTGNAANIKADIALSTSQQALNQPRTTLVVTPATGITADQAALTKYINTTVTKAVVTQSTGITAEQAKLEQQLQQQGRRLTTLEKTSTTQEKVNQQGLEEIKKQTSKLESIGLGLVALTTVAKGISTQTAPAAMQAAAAAGTCSTLKPGGCMSGLADNAANAAKNSAKNGGKLDSLLNASNAALDLDTNKRVRNIEAKTGANEYPMILPEYLLDDYLDTQVTIANQAQYNAWLLKQIDALVGLFPIKIERVNEDGQKQLLKFENISEAIAELTGLLAQIAFDADTAVNVATRATGEALGAKAAALQAGSYIKAIIDHIGFQTEHISIDVPVSVTLGATGIDGKLQESELKDFLKPSIQKTIGIKNTDPVDMRLVLRRILEDGEIVRAALYKPLKPTASENTLTGDAIKKEKEAEKQRLSDAWEAFKLRYESHSAGVKIDIDDGSENPTA